MKKSCLVILLLIHLCACSPIDSLKPFDQTQAAKLLLQHSIPIRTQQMIALTLPREQLWLNVDLSQNIQGTPRMLIPCDATIFNWTQSIRTMIWGYINDPSITAIKLVHNQILDAKNDCAQIHANIEVNSTHYIIYHLQFSACRDRKNQMQIGKAFNGVDAIYLVYYSAITGQVTELQFNKMIQVIKHARLVPNTFMRGK